MTADLLAYCGLFLTAVIAGSILPLQSEAALAALLLTTKLSPWLLLLAASAGNVSGSVINWWLGRGIERFKDRRWFPASAAKLEKAGAWYRRYGRWSLLLSWLPIVGDPLTIAAGMMKERFAVFLILVTIAKLGRYLVVTGLTLSWV